MTLSDFAALILGGFLLLMLWLVIGMFIHMLLDKFSLYEKIKYVHKFKIPEKYQTKVNPIYELTNNNWDGSVFYIKKWSLKYYQREGHQILSLFLIYPVEFLTYGYQSDDTIYLCKKKDIETVVGTLEENYERLWAIENEKYLTERALKDKQQDVINGLNKTFSENYE